MQRMNASRRAEACSIELLRVVTELCALVFLLLVGMSLRFAAPPCPWTFIRIFPSICLRDDEVRGQGVKGGHISASLPISPGHDSVENGPAIPTVSHLQSRMRSFRSRPDWVELSLVPAYSDLKLRSLPFCVSIGTPAEKKRPVVVLIDKDNCIFYSFQNEKNLKITFLFIIETQIIFSLHWKSVHTKMLCFKKWSTN